MDKNILILILAAMVLVAAGSGVRFFVRSSKGEAKIDPEDKGNPQNRRLSRRELKHRVKEMAHESEILEMAIQASKDGVCVDVNATHTRPASVALPPAPS